MSEISLNQTHIDSFGSVQSIFSRKLLTDARLGKAQLTDKFGVGLTQYLGRCAALHELGIVCDVVHQIKHLLVRIFDQGTSVDRGHKLKTINAATGISGRQY